MSEKDTKVEVNPKINIQQADPNLPPSEPKPAATVLLVRTIQESVEVLRDEFGINHIYAKNQRDLFFMQGYLAAKDRLFQFEIWRRQATGTVSEIFGESELERDIGTRLFMFRGDLKEVRKSACLHHNACSPSCHP